MFVFMSDICLGAAEIDFNRATLQSGTIGHAQLTVAFESQTWTHEPHVIDSSQAWTRTVRDIMYLQAQLLMPDIKGKNSVLCLFFRIHNYIHIYKHTHNHNHLHNRIHEHQRLSLNAHISKCPQIWKFLHVKQHY